MSQWQFISQVNKNQPKNMKKSTTRRVGQIRTSTTQPTPTLLPYQIHSLSINNINIYGQMKKITNSNQDIFQKYEHIIRDLQQVIQDLQQRNSFINGQRMRLLEENCVLKQQLQGFQHSYLVPQSRVRHITLFDVVAEEDSIPVVFPKSTMPGKAHQILEQSDFDIGPQHHYNDDISAELSISEAEAKSQQRTPCLKNHHTLIQCKSHNNQAPLRIFYLLLLQQMPYIKKLRQFLNECIQDQSKILMHLLPSNNQMWGKILQEFMDSVVKGQFENQKEIVEFISQNPLIDMLLVSLLKQCLPVDNQDQDLNIGDWKNQQIDHRALFLGLCNYFDFHFEDDAQNFIYKLYANIDQYQIQAVSAQSQSVSQQNLLQSRTVSQHRQKVAEISLFDRTGNNNTNVINSKRQPIFKIWLDPERLHYRISISIRPEKFDQTSGDGVQTNSFHRTENECESLQSGSEQGYRDTFKSIIKQDHLLREKDMNKQSSNRRKYLTVSDDYLKPRQQSKNISGSNSCANSCYE